MAIKTYWHQENNVGDKLAPIILKHFIGDVEFAKKSDTGKLLAVGSILTYLKKNDIVWGAGSIKNRKIVSPENVKYLAVRGKLTRDLITGAEVPEVYGDPALLMPYIYNPAMKRKIGHGYIPHYVDLEAFKKTNSGNYIINVRDDWQKVIRQILVCDYIVSSSLHGIILAEAYGKKAIWQQWGKKVVGGDFKFKDYLSGTGRDPRMLTTGCVLPPIKDLHLIQGKLIRVLREHYK